MSDIIVTRSRRGLFNVEEWETFAGENGGGPVDTRVFFRCREPSCWRIWTMEQAAYRVIDIEQNPIQCAECGSYNITATWCNVNERPNVWIGYGTTGTTLSTWLTMTYDKHLQALRDFRDEHGGRDPRPEDGAAWTSYQFMLTNVYIDYNKIGGTYVVNGETMSYPYDRNHYFEVFHNHLPNLTDIPFYTQTGKATQWVKSEVTSGDTKRIYYPKFNQNFYRCIINMAIQTEFTGGTGGSA